MVHAQYYGWYRIIKHARMRMEKIKQLPRPEVCKTGTKACACCFQQCQYEAKAGDKKQCSAQDDELAFWQETGSDDLNTLALTSFTWYRAARRFCSPE